MSSSRLICIKIGGSVITDKSKMATADMENITRFADGLAKAREQFPDADLLLGNGAGSFGHHSAHEYGLGRGAESPEQFYGVSLTHDSVRELNLLVGKSLVARGVPTYCLSPGDMFTAQDGEVVTANDELVRQLLRNNVIPLVHGDTVIDTTKGVSIFSTERSLFWLARTLRSQYDHVTVIMIMSPGGVLDPAGNVIPELARDASVEIAGTIKGVKDVTGGIIHKVEMCREAAAWADAVYLIGNTVDDIAAAFQGKPAGTKVL